jgi:mevalonate kinase
MKQIFYSNGKLLITGEYLVLDGAKAFALPTKFGQSLIIEKGSNKEIHWVSYDHDGSVWFENTIPFSAIINPIPTRKESVHSTLITILHQAYLLNPKFINDSHGYKVITNLSFPIQWGLGTSSTLINNIAQWTQVNAFTLLDTSFGGSGYDIACAQNDTPILYQIKNGQPTVETISFTPEFTQNIYFVYLNKKQNSKTAINSYQRTKTSELNQNIVVIDKITTAMLQAQTIEQFGDAIEKHETAMSHTLETSTIKERLFSDFEGQIKSLGAWGGDFVMVLSIKDPTAYFKEKGYEIVLAYDQMILL